MAKLKLKESCYNGIENVVVKEIHRTSDHKTLVKEANTLIRRLRKIEFVMQLRIIKQDRI